jgi:hypothetical protein
VPLLLLAAAAAGYSSTDANIVLYDGPANAATPYWASNTQFRTNRLPLRLCMQADGNLVAYDSTNAAYWASNSAGTGRNTVTTFIQVLPQHLAA